MLPIITGSNLITISTLNILTISFQTFSIFLTNVLNCLGIHFMLPIDMSLAPNASRIIFSLTINVPPRNVFFNASRFTFDMLSQVLFPTTSLYTESVITYSPSESILISPLFTWYCNCLDLFVLIALSKFLIFVSFSFILGGNILATSLTSNTWLLTSILVYACLLVGLISEPALAFIAESSIISSHNTSINSFDSSTSISCPQVLPITSIGFVSSPKCLTLFSVVTITL